MNKESGAINLQNNNYYNKGYNDGFIEGQRQGLELVAKYISLQPKKGVECNDKESAERIFNILKGK